MDFNLEVSVPKYQFIVQLLQNADLNGKMPGGVVLKHIAL